MKVVSEPGELVHVSVRGLLFDMDGVLVSSLGSVERSWKLWAERHHKDIASTIQIAHGRRAIDTLRTLLPGGDLPAELKIIEDLEVADSEGIRPLAGVIPLLKLLPSSRWTVVTSATERLAVTRLRHGGIPLPDRIVAGDMVEHGKPSPEPYLRGAEILGLNPEDCIVIEDTGAGVEAGRAAGAKVLATTFSHPIAQLREANWIVKSLEDVTVSVLNNQDIELAILPVTAPA